MTIGVALDGDGHFHAAPIDNRKKVLNILKLIQDGDHFADMLNDKEIPTDKLEDVLKLSQDEWFEYYFVFVQRGAFETIEL